MIRKYRGGADGLSSASLRFKLQAQGCRLALSRSPDEEKDESEGNGEPLDES